ncbi:hypothetical protein A6C57_27875 (plasmid) [Fibrella sp. ES10-3-2-2]
MKSYLLILLVLSACYSKVAAQDDTIRQSNYFFEQSALSYPKRSLTYNNQYFIINSLMYQISNRLKFSAGTLITGERPPLYVTVQYAFPVSSNTNLGVSLGYFQITYDRYKSSYFVLPQVLLTKGDHRRNTTLSIGTTQGRFLLPGSFFNPMALNLPSRVNVLMSLSHRRPITKNISLISQNVYISSQVPTGSPYSNIFILSIGGGWHIDKNAIKIGMSALLFPNRNESKLANFLPFLGYSRVIN